MKVEKATDDRRDRVFMAMLKAELIRPAGGFTYWRRRGGMLVRTAPDVAIAAFLKANPEFQKGPEKP